MSAGIWFEGLVRIQEVRKSPLAQTSPQGREWKGSTSIEVKTTDCTEGRKNPSPSQAAHISEASEVCYTEHRASRKERTSVVAT